MQKKTMKNTRATACGSAIGPPPLTATAGVPFRVGLLLEQLSDARTDDD